MASSKKPKTETFSSHPILPLLANATTLNFDSARIAIRYALQKQTFPTTLSKHEQLADIEYVDPKAKEYLHRTEQRYEELKADKRSRASGQGARETRFSLNSLAGKSPLALARLLDIMARPYHLPLPYQVPVSDHTFNALIKQFKKKDVRSLRSLDMVIHRFLNHSPAWHLDMAQRIEEVAAYLDLKEAINEFILGNTAGKPSERQQDFSSNLWGRARAIRKTFASDAYKDWRPLTTPSNFVLTVISWRLQDYLRELTSQPGYTFITALIQTAPFIKPYRHYCDSTEDAIRKRLRKRSY